MISGSLWRWIMLDLLRRPWVTPVSLAFFLAPLLIAALLPTGGEAGDPSLCASWAFPAALMGIAGSSSVLTRGAPFLARLDRTTRFVTELGALVLGGICLQLPIFAAALLSRLAPSDLARFVPSVLLCVLQLASVALLLLTLPVPAALRPAAFFGGAWLVPALCRNDEVLRRAAALFDAPAVLRSPTPGTLASASAATAAFALASFLLRARSESSSAHEVRHPR